MKNAQEMTTEELQNYFFALVTRIKTLSGDPPAPIPYPRETSGDYGNYLEKYHRQLEICEKAVEILRKHEKFDSIFSDEFKSKLAEILSIKPELLKTKYPNDILIDLGNQMQVLKYKIFEIEFDILKNNYDEIVENMPRATELALYSQQLSKLTAANERIKEIKIYLDQLPDNLKAVSLFKITTNDANDLCGKKRSFQGQFVDATQITNLCFETFQQELMKKSSEKSEKKAVTSAPPTAISQQTHHNTVTTPGINTTPTERTAETPQQNQGSFNKIKFQSDLIAIETNISKIMAERISKLQTLQGKDYNPSAMNDIKTQCQVELLQIRKSLGTLRQLWQNYCVQRHQISPQNAATEREFASQITVAFKHLDDKIRKAETTINEKSTFINISRQEAKQSPAPAQVSSPKPRAQ